MGCYWTRGGCNSGRWGPRAVRTTLVQWIPTLVEQADSRRSRRRVIASRPSAQVAGRERCRKICDGDAGHCRKTHGLSLLRGLVSTVLTLTGSASVHPAGIVGILRFLSGVQPRFGVNVSAVDTTPVTPHPFGPLASWTTSLPRVPARASVSEVMTPTCLRSEETVQIPPAAFTTSRGSASPALRHFVPSESPTSPSGLYLDGDGPPHPAPAQAKTTVRCPLSSTRCSVCQRTACASTRRSTSCPLACSTDTESSCPARVTSCSMIGPSSRSAVT